MFGPLLNVDVFFMSSLPLFTNLILIKMSRPLTHLPLNIVWLVSVTGNTLTTQQLRLSINTHRHLRLLEWLDSLAGPVKYNFTGNIF